MYALARGMGCGGAHIGGMNISHKMVTDIVARGEELLADWPALVKEFDYPQENGAYYFARDDATGLNREEAHVHRQKARTTPLFWIGYLAHHAVFDPKSLLFKMLKPLAAGLDKVGWMKRSFGWCEHQVKVALFGCLNCGDCGLFDVAYQCPMSQCPKNQRNGPCGGSYHGWCEVYPDEKKCIWVKAYERMRVLKQEDAATENVVPPVDWALWETSSWLNFYNGRDHSARRLGVRPPGVDKDKTASS